MLITGTGRSLASIGDTIAWSAERRGWDVTRSTAELTDGTLRIPEGLKALVMCHGTNAMGWFEETNIESARLVMDVNLFGSYRMAVEFVRATIDLPYRKKIVMMGSMAYTKVLNASAAYCASKAGLSMLARCMAFELAPKGYDVFIVHPSNVDGTPMAADTIEGIARYRGVTTEEAEEYWADSYLRGRSLTTDEIASLVLDLIERPDRVFLAGTDIELNGGAR